MSTYPEKQSDKVDAAEVKNYTRTPNMLIFGYRTISPQEKWLYTCLKHLCGKTGTRHLSLRYISDQTGISTGALSLSKDKSGKVNEGMIHHLHDAGLIHSEIKKHNGKGNPQYHITITDVWGLNQDFFTTRSDFGQDEENASELRTDNTLTRPKSEQACPKSEQGRPKSEQACPNSSTILRESKITDKTIEQEVSVTASTSPDETSTPPAHTHSFSSQEKAPTRSGAKQSPPPGKTPAKSEHSAQAEAIRALYDSIALGTGKLSGHPHWDWTALEEMVAANPTEEEIRLVYTHLKANQKKCSVQAVWENWTLLASLKKPVFVSSTPPRSVIVEDDEPQRPFLKPSDTHKSRYGSLAAVGGGR